MFERLTRIKLNLKNSMDKGGCDENKNNNSNDNVNNNTINIMMKKTNTHRNKKRLKFD